MFYKFKKTSIKFLLLFFIFTSVFGNLMMVKPVKAAGAVADSVLGSIGSTFYTKSIQDLVEGDLEDKITVGIFKAVMRATTYFVQKVSYDLAVFAASGGKGQGALVFDQGFGSYMEDVGNHAVGSAIDELGNALGLNLCSPPNLALDLTLRLGLKGKYCDPETGQGGDGSTQGDGSREEGVNVCQPHCTLSDFKNNWSKVGGGDYWKNTAQQFSLSIKPSQSDIGFYMEASQRIDEIEKKKTEGKQLERLETLGGKDFVGAITGKIKTPGRVIMKEKEESSPGTKVKDTQKDMSASYATGAKEMPLFAVSVFLNTFLSTVLENFMSGMYWDSSGGGGGGYDSPLRYEGNVRGGIAEARKHYRNMLSIELGNIETYNLLSEFSQCDDKTRINSCTIDGLLEYAIRQADFGQSLTIAEAIDLEYLSPNRLLKGPEYFVNNPQSAKNNCWEKFYCYDNIKKLRQARILPLGFEIAASLIGQENITLQKVIDDFRVEGSRFYHLIDPDWILKMPQARCDQYAYGASVEPDTDIRLKECVDLKSCIKERTDGSCEEYGYCVVEKNVWNFNLDPCSPEYRTCQTFSSDGEEVSYVTRSVDAGHCDAENSGCSSYATVMNFVDKENPSWVYTDNLIYATKADSCSSGSAGCTAFKIASNLNEDPIYLRRAPEKYALKEPITESLKTDNNCYHLYDKHRPATKAEFNELEDYKELAGITEECNKYAQLCIPEEEDCNLYKPITYPSYIEIPAKFKPAEIIENKIKWNDQCDQSCVGYNSYEELPSNYSNGVSLTYIIPKSGNTCSNPGCSAFTNLTTASGQTEDVEYYSYLRSCVKPNTESQKTYVTYESGGVEGYQLKTYLLVNDENGDTGDVGAPKYFYRSQDDLNKYNEICSEEVYWAGHESPSWFEGDYNGSYLSSVDCRQINDEQGNIYYRLLSKTIAVSEHCTAYRLNSTELYVDEGIDETECKSVVDVTVESTVGYWDVENEKCNVCFQNGEYRNGHCYYMGMPRGSYHPAGISDACPLIEDSCRVFKGNAGNNIQELFLDRFESSSTTEALADWDVDNNVNDILSTEATQKNGHSLRFVSLSADDVLTKDVEILAEQTYELTFWAKGTTKDLEVFFGDILITETNTKLGVSDDWRNYKINHIATADATQIKFKLESGNPFKSKNLFIDNVRLVKVTEHLLLVKDTLNIPLVCDSEPDDIYPGEALGCATYGYNSLGKTNQVHLTNFSYLCREGAVGCTKLIDTHNTSEIGPRAYNIWLNYTADNINEDREAVVTVVNNTYKCDIIDSESQVGCFLPEIIGYTKDEIETADLEFTTSSIYIPAEDTNDPIYLVANQEASCNAVDEGCLKVAKINLTANASAPDFDEMYLKLNDPDKYSEILCKEREVGCRTYQSKDGAKRYFKDPKVLGGKVCEYKKSVDYINDENLELKANGWFWKEVGKCSAVDSDVYGDYCNTDSNCSKYEKCEKKGDWPCYGEDEDYVITNGGYFGLWSYDMDRYGGFVGECPSNQHSCTKFIDHNDIDKEAELLGVERGVAYYFLANEKLKKSIADPSCAGLAGIKGGCVLLDKTDDPVKLYLTSSTYARSFKEEGRLVRPYSGGDKNDANLIVKAVQDRECASWYYCSSPNDENGSCDVLGMCQKVDNGTITGCASRGGDVSTSWSMYNKEIKYEKVDSLDKCKEQESDEFNYYCRDIDWSSPDYSGYVLYTPDESTLQLIDLNIVVDYKENKNNLKCKIYPRADSPYSTSIIPDFERSKEYIINSPFLEVNTFYNSFNPKNLYENDCGYRKISYGNGIKSIYLPADVGVAPDKLCVGGKYDGYNEDDFKDEKFSCASSSGQFYEKDLKIEKVKGERGYCVEYDKTRIINNSDRTGGDIEYACLTWLPVNVEGFGLGRGGAISDSVSINPYNPNPISGSDIDRYVCLHNESLVEYTTDLDKGFTANLAGFGGWSYDKFCFGGACKGRELHYPPFVKDQIIFDAEYVLDVSGEDLDKDFGHSKFTLNKDFVESDGYSKYKNTSIITQPVSAFNREILSTDGNYTLYSWSFQSKYTPYYNNATPVINKEDIKRIDVYTDIEKDLPHSSLISFIPYLMFDENGEFTEAYDYGKETSESDGHYQFGVDNYLGYNWWGFKNIVGAQNNWYNVFLTRGYEDMSRAGVFSSIPVTGITSLGVRIWFDENEDLKGFEYAINHHINNGAEVGFIFFIYLNNGECKKIAQVWSEEDGGKPYAGNLITDSFGIDSVSSLRGLMSVNVPYRAKDTGLYSDYGLVKEGFGNSDNGGLDSEKRIRVDPSSPAMFNNGESPTSITGHHYDSYGYELEKWNNYLDYYQAGIPLTLYGGYGYIDYHYDYNLENYNPTGVSLLNHKTLFDLLLYKMYAKVYGIWEWNGTSWVDENISYDISSPSNKHYPKQPPQIVPPMFLDSDCDDRNKDDLLQSCGAVEDDDGFVNGFSINGYYPGYTKNGVENHQGDIAFEETGIVKLGYYIYGNENQGPIREIRINSDNARSSLPKVGNIRYHQFNCDGLEIYDVSEGDWDSCVQKHLSSNITYSCRLFTQMLVKPEENKSYEDLRIEDIKPEYKYGVGKSGLAGLIKLSPVWYTPPQIEEKILKESQDNIYKQRHEVLVEEEVLNKAGLGSLGYGNLVCVYTPKIQVKDNWDWCNGDCSEYNNFDGCYKCDKDTEDAWTTSGRVIVKPPSMPAEIGSAKNDITWDYLEDFLGSE